MSQFVLTDYTPDSPCDTVDLGYDNRYTLCQREFGEIKTQCVTVPPSCLQTLDGKMTDQGRQKSYWSDGDYLFTMEAGYDMDEQMLERIFASIKPVKDVSPYVRVEYRKPAPSTHETVAQPLFPTYIPDGWTLTDGSGLQGDNSYTWIWTDGNMSGLELLQTADPNYRERLLLPFRDEGEIKEIKHGGLKYRTLETQTQSIILWKSDSEVFFLSSRGDARLNVQMLLEIADSLSEVE